MEHTPQSWREIISIVILCDANVGAGASERELAMASEWAQEYYLKEKKIFTCPSPEEVAKLASMRKGYLAAKK